jgi:hypothetical protein
MIGGSSRSTWNIKDQDAAVGVRNFVDGYPEAQLIQNPRLDLVQVAKGCCAHNAPWLLVADTEDQPPSSLVRDRNAISEQPRRVILVLGFLEFEPLGLARQCH